LRAAPLPKHAHGILEQGPKSAAPWFPEYRSEGSRLCTHDRQSCIGNLTHRCSQTALVASLAGWLSQMSRRRTKYSNNHRKTRSQAVYGTQTGAPCVSGSTSKPSVSEEFEVACRENKRKIARQLLEDFSAEALEPLSKPDVQIRANALTWACCVGLVDIVQTIFELLPPSALGAVQPAFARACHYGQHEVVELFFSVFSGQSLRFCTSRAVRGMPQRTDTCSETLCEGFP